MFNKILSIFIVMLLSYSLLKSLYVQFIKMRCRVTGVFCAFDNPENAEIPPRMKFEYKVGDNVYYYTMANTLRLTSGENAKLDLAYNPKKPEQATMAGSYISLITKVVLLACSISNCHKAFLG